MAIENFEEVYVSRRFFITTTLFLVLLLIGVAGLGGYFYWQYLKAASNNQFASASAIQHDTDQLIQDVGQLIVLPQGEVPTVATVSDPSALKNQPFFANAEKGDKVLVYTTAGKAILYRPSSRKIIEVAPTSLGNQQSSQQSQSQSQVQIQPVSSPSPKPTASATRKK